MPNFNQETLNKAYRKALLYCIQNCMGRTGLFNDTQLLHGVISGIYPLEFLNSHVLYTLLSNFDKPVHEFDGYISAFIKSTEEYHRLTTLYDDYTTIIANLIKENSNEIFDVASYYIKLLHNGIFSYDCGFHYQLLKTDYDKRLDVFGARITSGFGVCRHMAMNLKDVYDKLNYDAAYMVCRRYYKNHDSNSKKLEASTHAIVGVANEKKSLIVCPTWKAIGRFDYPKKEIATLKRLRDLNESPFYFSIDPKMTYKAGNDNYTNYLKFLGHNNYFNNNLDSLTQRYTDISSKIQQNLLYYIEWNAKHQDLFKEIAELEKLLSCYKELDVVRTRR